MRRLLRLALPVFILLAGWFILFPHVAQAQSGTSVCDPDGVQSSGAIYRICMPAGDWNGDLVVYAHGYVSPLEPIGIPEDQLTLPDGSSLVDLITGLGYAFATTSYSTNGLAVPEGVRDVTELVSIFATTKGEPEHVYLTGPSEGGLVTILGVEQHPDTFDGGLSTCGPVGNFQRQTDYFGDFRVIFDYFFPGVLPPSPIAIPQQVMADWETVYEPAIRAAIAQDPHATEQLLRVTRAAYDPADPATREKTVVWNLWYNVFATNDAITKLGGQPYGNQHTLYVGSDDDIALNLGVERFRANPQAKVAILERYTTSGRLQTPVVIMHNLLDPIVPYWHEPLYTQKVRGNRAGFQLISIPIARYGHCNFEPEEVLAAFGILVFRVEGDILDASAVLPDAAARQRFNDMMRQYGVPVP
jgi:pimeloyl-ACP methyl ester carboxylesterase